MKLKQVCSFILEAPVYFLSSKKTPLGKKIGFGIVFGIFTLFSAGAYAVYAHNYFKNRKITHVGEAFHEAIRNGDINTVDQLLKKHPLLKKNLTDNLRCKNQTFEIAAMDAITARQLNMLKFLVKQGADLKKITAGREPGDYLPYGVELTPLEKATQMGDLEIVKYLLEEIGVTPSPSALYFSYDMNISKISPDIINYWIEKDLPLSKSLEGVFFCLTQSPTEETTKMVKLLLEKKIYPSKHYMASIHPDIKSLIPSDLVND